MFQKKKSSYLARKAFAFSENCRFTFKESLRNASQWLRASKTHRLIPRSRGRSLRMLRACCSCPRSAPLSWGCSTGCKEPWPVWHRRVPSPLHCHCPAGGCSPAYLGVWQPGKASCWFLMAPRGWADTRRPRGWWCSRQEKEKHFFFPPSIKTK